MHERLNSITRLTFGVLFELFLGKLAFTNDFALLEHCWTGSPFNVPSRRYIWQHVQGADNKEYSAHVRAGTFSATIRIRARHPISTRLWLRGKSMHSNNGYENHQGICKMSLTEGLELERKNPTPKVYDSQARTNTLFITSIPWRSLLRQWMEHLLQRPFRFASMTILIPRPEPLSMCRAKVFKSYCLIPLKLQMPGSIPTSVKKSCVYWHPQKQGSHFACPARIGGGNIPTPGERGDNTPSYKKVQRKWSTSTYLELHKTSPTVWFLALTLLLTYKSICSLCGICPGQFCPTIIVVLICNAIRPMRQELPNRILQQCHKAISMP